MRAARDLSFGQSQSGQTFAECIRGSGRIVVPAFYKSGHHVRDIEVA